MSKVDREIYVGPPTSPERWEANCAREEEEHKRINRAYLVEGLGYLIEGIDGTEDLEPLRIDSTVLDEAPDHVKTVIGHVITRTDGDISFSKSVIEDTATVHMVLTSGHDMFTFKVSKKADGSDVKTDVHQRHVPSSVSSLVSKWFSDLELVRAMNWLLQYNQRVGQQAPEPTAA